MEPKTLQPKLEKTAELSMNLVPEVLALKITPFDKNAMSVEKAGLENLHNLIVPSLSL